MRACFIVFTLILWNQIISLLIYLFQLRGYKVTDVNRMRKIGIACRNFQDLKRKACSKLNVSIYMLTIDYID